MDKRTELIELLDGGVPLKNICDQLAVPPYVAYMWIKQAGRQVPMSAANICGANIRKGMLGEKKFLELVPDALDMNRSIQNNNPGYDFDYKGLKIDVKTSTLNDRGKWSIRIKSDADCIVAFLGKNEKLKDNETTILLLPVGLLPQKNTIHPQSNTAVKYSDFVVKPEELAEAIEAIA